MHLVESEPMGVASEAAESVTLVFKERHVRVQMIPLEGPQRLVEVSVTRLTPRGRLLETYPAIVLTPSRVWFFWKAFDQLRPYKALVLVGEDSGAYLM